ncbi:hypothetical protein LKMONMHP_4679 [Methylobacterium organophilum]|uniref:Uncharacterized protein n=1 Tax=Methylobacterium organophilum TaxID=410 RepID=A0ABQ4TDX4_METOR|nr:hypothetical protein LKMONMHP_4679 [Methylobacterium organophilum]
MSRLLALLVLAGIAAAAAGRRPGRSLPAYVFPMSRTVH